MKFTRELPGTLTIKSVANEGIQIDDQCWSETIAVTPQEVIADWPIVAFDELSAEHLSSILERSPELLIIGSGARGKFAPRELTFAFARAGVGLEVMDTAAAARTFNVLAGEGRKLAAILYPL